jgi:hypothetical protein
VERSGIPTQHHSSNRLRSIRETTSAGVLVRVRTVARELLSGDTTGLCCHHWADTGFALAKTDELRIDGLDPDEARRPSGLFAQADLRIAASIGLGEIWLVSAQLDGMGPLALHTDRLTVQSKSAAEQFSTPSDGRIESIVTSFSLGLGWVLFALQPVAVAYSEGANDNDQKPSRRHRPALPSGV